MHGRGVVYFLLLETLYASIFFFLEPFRISLSSVLKLHKDVPCFFASIVLDTWCALSIQKFISFYSEKCNWTISLTVSYSLVSVPSFQHSFYSDFWPLGAFKFSVFHSFLFLSTCCQLHLSNHLFNVYAPVVIIYKHSSLTASCFCFMDSGRFCIAKIFPIPVYRACPCTWVIIPALLTSDLDI